MEELAEAGGGADSAASKLFTTAGNLFDRSRPPLPAEDLEEAGGGAEDGSVTLACDGDDACNASISRCRFRR